MHQSVSTDTQSPPAFTYEGPRATGGLQGHIYVVEFIGGGIKVGQTRNPTSRIRSHERSGRSFGRPISRVWISGPHIQYAKNERALINHCHQALGLPDDDRPIEYFAYDYDLAVAFAESLPQANEHRQGSAAVSAIMGGNIRLARAKRLIHQKQLAATLGMSTGTISQIERGSRTVSVNDLLPLCEALDVDLRFLLDGLSTADMERFGLV